MKSQLYTRIIAVAVVLALFLVAFMGSQQPAIAKTTVHRRALVTVPTTGAKLAPMLAPRMAPAPAPSKAYVPRTAVAAKAAPGITQVVTPKAPVLTG